MDYDEMKGVQEKGKVLNVKEILQKTFSTYRRGFKIFLCLSSVSLLPVAGETAIEVLSGYSLLLMLLLLVFSIVMIYFSIRMSASIYLLARDLTHEKQVTFKEAVQCSRGFAGTYFAVSLLYGLIYLLPLAGIIVTILLAENILLKAGLIILFGIPFVFLYTRYYLAIAAALLSDRLNGEFETSKTLVKGNFFRVLTVIVLTYGVYVLLIQFLGFWAGSTEIGTALSLASVIAECAVLVLFTPISMIAAVHMYQDLLGQPNAASAQSPETVI